MPALEKSLSLIWQGKTPNLIQPEPTSVIGGINSYKIDLSAKCGFSCLYCSSNCSKLMTSNLQNIKKWSKKQFHLELNPLTNSYKFGVYYKKPVELIEKQLRQNPNLKSIKTTLQFGILTDGFDPYLVNSQISLEALKLLFKETKFNIRILTKSISVAQPQFLALFDQYKKRVSVGISCSTLDNNFTKQVELRTSLPSARISAIRTLQNNGITTFGMFCPILPGFEGEEDLVQLYDAFNPRKLTEIWTEPFTDKNWKYFYKNLKSGSLKKQIKSTMQSSVIWAQYVERLAQNHALAIDKLKFKGRSKVLIYAPSLIPKQIQALEKSGMLFR